MRAGLVFDEDIREWNPVQTLREKMEGKEIDAEKIKWLNTVKDHSKYVYAINGYYGNDYSINESYCELAILINA